MTTLVVSDPCGRTWRVRRRWIPHREGRGLEARLQRRKQRRSGGGNSVHIPADFGIEPSAAVILVVLAILSVIVLIAAPGIILLGVDLVWFLVVFLGGVFAHFVLGRPWRVEAVADDGTRHDEGVRGYRAAGQRCEHLAAELVAGVHLPEDPTRDHP